jgi:hypothetical protein
MKIAARPPCTCPAFSTGAKKIFPPAAPAFAPGKKDKDFALNSA